MSDAGQALRSLFTVCDDGGSLSVIMPDEQVLADALMQFDARSRGGDLPNVPAPLVLNSSHVNQLAEERRHDHA